MAENQRSEDGARLRPTFVIRAVHAPLGADGKAIAPSPRGGATLTQLASGDVYLIGGANREAQSCGDVFRLDLGTRQWHGISPLGEALPARSGHAAVAMRDKIYVIGGMNATECVLYDDVFVLDTRAQTWTRPVVEGWIPAARNAHAAIALPPTSEGHDRILVFGGSSPEEGPFDDVYILHIPVDDDHDAPLRWERCECGGLQKPEARELHVASLLTPTAILFSGGRNRDGNICTDMAVLDIETWQWQVSPICEWNRCSHAAACVDGMVVSFGGFDGSAIRGDCWAYDDDEESWVRVRVAADDMTPRKASDSSTRPETTEDEASTVAERFGHCGCAVELPKGNGDGAGETPSQGLLVFGGINAERDLNDLVLVTRVVEG